MYIHERISYVQTQRHTWHARPLRHPLPLSCSGRFRHGAVVRAARLCRREMFCPAASMIPPTRRMPKGEGIADWERRAGLEVVQGMKQISPEQPTRINETNKSRTACQKTKQQDKTGQPSRLYSGPRAIPFPLCCTVTSSKRERRNTVSGISNVSELGGANGSTLVFAWRSETSPVRSSAPAAGPADNAAAAKDSSSRRRSMRSHLAFILARGVWRYCHGTGDSRDA